jgi:hypothetical protein
MTHIAIQEALNGKPVDWMENVSDEQYQRKKGETDTLNGVNGTSDIEGSEPDWH